MTGPQSLVFVYGTLTAAERVAALLNDWRFDGEAILEGLERVEGRYPTLAPGGVTEGRLLCTPQVDRLDAYEGVDRGLYIRAAVPMADGGIAWIYVGDPARLDASVTWPGTDPLVDRVRAYVEAEGVQIRRQSNR